MCHPVLTKDGRIVIGEFGVNYSRAGSSGGGVVSSGSKKKLTNHLNARLEIAAGEA